MRFAFALAAQRYLTSALDVIERHSVRRHDVDWAALRARAHERASDALTRRDTYDPIRFVLDSLGDHHSGFLEPAALVQLEQLPADAAATPAGRILPHELAMVVVRSFVAARQNAIDRYATRLYSVVRDLDASNPCAWIVDLRENAGGNMWPMLAGLGPLIGDGRVGAFVDPDGTRTEWFYVEGRSQEDTRTRARVAGQAYRLHRSLPPVAVLLGPATASSGEAVAVAFRQRENARTFGERTRGQTTSNDLFKLSDGAAVNLSVSTFADRAGHTYPDGIEPDEPAERARPGELPAAAERWLLRQSSCRGEK